MVPCLNLIIINWKGPEILAEAIALEEMKAPMEEDTVLEALKPQKEVTNDAIKIATVQNKKEVAVQNA